MPMVSVVIPMRNEVESIGALLDGVLAQDYPPERLEVLVIDGDSNDGSVAVIEGYAVRDARVRLVRISYPIVGMTNSASDRAPVGQRVVMVLSRV